MREHLTSSPQDPTSPDTQPTLYDIVLRCQSAWAMWQAAQTPHDQELASDHYRHELQLLWEAYAPELRRVAAKWLHADIASDRESLAHSAFVAIIKKLPSLHLDPQRNVAGLLWTITHRWCYEQNLEIRDLPRPGKTNPDAPAVPNVQKGTIIHLPLDDHASELTETDRYDERLHDLDRAMYLDVVWSFWRATLSTIDQQIVTLRWNGDPPATFGEVAQQLGPGWTEMAVRRRHHRIIERTRRHLQTLGLLDDQV